MEFLISTSATIFSFLLFLCSIFFSIQNFFKRRNKQNKTPPEAAGAWPIIGHLHLLGGQQPLHMKLGSWADKYGPIFSIKLGVYQSLIVSDSKMAKECFTTNDKVFATRPKSLAVELMGYNYALFALAPYGPYWRLIRKIVVLEFLSNRRIQILADIQVSQVQSSMKNLYDIWLKGKNTLKMVKVEMKEFFEQFSINSAVRMLVGKRYTHEEEEWIRFQKAMKKLPELLGTFMVSDAIPWLRWLDLGGYQKIMRKAGKEMDDILEGWLKEHRAKWDAGQVKGEQQDFLDAMLAHVDSAPEDFPGYDTDTVNKAVCLTLLSGATETVTVTLTWALSLLLSHPNVLKNVRDELDIHVGRDRQVKQSDLANLIYLPVVVKEILRLYPPAPLAVPHEAMEDCVVGGYKIPKGTRLFVNIWKIHHHHEAWKNPNKFEPERFLMSDEDIDLKGQHFDLIPFGSGRRMCPGMSFGLQAVQLAIASLVHAFEIVTPTNEPIDMSVLPGLTNVKATPLEVLLSPRLSANLYG